MLVYVIYHITVEFLWILMWICSQCNTIQSNTICIKQYRLSSFYKLPQKQWNLHVNIQLRFYTLYHTYISSSNKLSKKFSSNVLRPGSKPVGFYGSVETTLLWRSINITHIRNSKMWMFAFHRRQWLAKLCHHRIASFNRPPEIRYESIFFHCLNQVT